MTYTDKHEISVKEISVATFNGDPFAVESNDDMIWIESEEDAQSWLDEIGDEQPERAGWLKGILSSGKYGLYAYDSDLEYLKGDESFMFDVYYYDIEKRY